MSLYLVYTKLGEPTRELRVPATYEVRRGDALLFDVLDRGETLVQLPPAKDGERRKAVAKALDDAAKAIVAAVEARLSNYTEALAYVVTQQRARFPLEGEGFGALLKDGDPKGVV